MGLYLTIPDIVESEVLHSLSPDHDGLTFRAVMDVGDAAVRLVRASEIGEHIPLVVLTTDAQILALDSVYVTEASISGQQPYAYFAFAAQAVRFV
jgi:hypothetical protein